MHGNQNAAGAGKLILEFLLGGIDDHGGMLVEQQSRDFNEAIELTLADLFGMQLIDLALIVE